MIYTNAKYVVLFLIFLVVSCRENNFQQTNEIAKKNIDTSFDYLPSSTSGAVYERNSYSFSYIEDKEQAEWVAYFLDKQDLIKNTFNRPYFNQDPIVKTKSADWRNYKNSGYDKGHLCPAGDRKASYANYEETFFTSNIAPQLPEFNAGVWNRLEQKVRYWTEKGGGLYVVTGGVLTEKLNTIGKENVAIPNYFYKILMNKQATKMIAFLVPHIQTNKPLYSFVVSVDEVESLTGIDFFPKLEDSLENQLEKNNSYKDWSF